MHEGNTNGAPEPPDDRLAAAQTKDAGDAPKVYAVTNLKAYVKPPMEEEITTSHGEPAGGSTGIGVGVICTCVPVETCACFTVTYPSGNVICPADPGDPCGCTGTCSCNPHCTCVPV